MGLMRFQVTHRDRIPDEALDRVYMTGGEDVPWPTQARIEKEHLLIRRETSDSGNLHVPWAAPGQPELMLSTASLMERETPYQLEVELARGAVNLIRNQLGYWQLAGLMVTAAIRDQLREATGVFSRAATSQHKPALAADYAVQTLDIAIALNRTLGASYTDQATTVRRRNTKTLSTLLGVNLGTRALDQDTANLVLNTFNATFVSLGWRQIEAREDRRDWSVPDQHIDWCQRSGLRVCGGPIIQLDAAGMPDWAYLFEDNFEHLLASIDKHIRATVTRYRGKVQLWHVASRVNFGERLSLTEEERLRIVVHAVRVVRELDPRTPLVVGFNQPWGEYLARHDFDLAPIHFADTLVRAELGLAGLAMEINAGYHPGGTLPHDLISYSRMLDRWSTLGLPLMISITAPSSGEVDPRATSKAKPLCGTSPDNFSLETQKAWTDQIVPLMLAKNSVQIISWNHLRDQDPHDFPHSGLLDATNQPKPALAALLGIRKRFLS